MTIKVKSPAGPSESTGAAFGTTGTQVEEASGHDSISEDDDEDDYGVHYIIDHKISKNVTLLIVITLSVN